MKDNVLDGYIRKLLSEDIEEEKFKEYIDIFSKFLGYLNPDYKYNGTYLSQYVDDFQNVYRKLKEKKEKYVEIYIGLFALLQNFELVIDRVFYAVNDFPSKVGIEYIGIDKNRIISASVEVQITIKYEKNQYMFCKEYENFEDGLLERVCNDIKNFMNIKRGENNDIA